MSDTIGEMHFTAKFALFLAPSTGPIIAAVMTINGAPVDVPVCGGIVGLQCGGDEWCDYPDGSACGAADMTGICKPRPDFCTRIYRPVCGCDGKTHSNRCVAETGGVDVLHEGVCSDG